MKSWKTLCALSCCALLYGCASDLITPPYEGHPNLKTADMARERGDIPQAIHDYRDIIKENPQCERAYIGLGMSLLDANALDEAKATFDKEIALFPHSSGAHTGLAIVYLAMDRPEDALQVLDKALKCNPRYTKAINSYGIALDMMGDHEAAQAHYRAAMELDSCNPSYESNLALSIALAGNPKEGIRILEKLVQSPKATPRVRQNLALAYGLAGDMQMARKIGKVDLSDEMVNMNINYMKAVKETSNWGGLIPVNHTPPLDQARSWQGRH